MTEDYDFDLFEPQMPQEAFHLETDLYDTGEYHNLLVIPCNDAFIVVSNNEHFTTIVQNWEDGWEQRDGQVEDEIFEKLSTALDEYINNR